LQLRNLQEILSEEIALTRSHIIRDVTDINMQFMYSYVMLASIQSKKYYKNSINMEDIKYVTENGFCYLDNFCCNETSCWYKVASHEIRWTSKLFLDVTPQQINYLLEQRKEQQLLNPIKLSNSQLQVALLPELDTFGRKYGIYDFFILTDRSNIHTVRNRLIHRHSQFIGLNDDFSNSAQSIWTGQLHSLMQMLWSEQAPWET